MSEWALDAVTVDAPAKVNLYLHVTGRRPDGYHLLDSLIAFAGIGDALRVQPDNALSLRVSGPFAAAVPSGPDNLVLRAARALADAAGIEARADIHLIKRLPVAAGIGGGSADAAAALKALTRLWAVSPTGDDLYRLALTLGADVPVCLAGHPAGVSGIGEAIAPAPALPDCWMVLVNPGVPIPTPDVFKRRQGPFSPAAPLRSAPASAEELVRELAQRGNDLTAAAVALEPVVGTVLAELDLLPGVFLSRMSGSGATCFALFAARDESERGAQRLRQQHPGWWIESAPLAAA